MNLIPTKRGLNDANSFKEQPPLSTPFSLNMRTQQPGTGRLRVSKRNGYKRFNSRVLLTNWLAFSEDFSHFRDTNEGDQPFPMNEAWVVRGNEPRSLSATADGTLGPDGVSAAYLVKQIQALSSNRPELSQNFDVNPVQTTVSGKPGAVFVRTPGKDLMLSCYMKASDAFGSKLAIRQGTGASAPATTVTITWSGGVPSLSASTSGAGSHVFSFSDEGGGWYRIWAAITWSQAFEGTDPVLRAVLSPVHPSNGADTAIKGTYFFGAQLELVDTGAQEPSRYEPSIGKNDPALKQSATSMVAINYLESPLSFLRNNPLVVDRSASTPGKGDVRKIALDRQDARYVLESQAVVKYTDKGELVFTIPVPVVDQQQVCNALCVSNIDDVFVGVTSGGDSKKARLFCYGQGPDVVNGELVENSFHQRWVIETGQYVTDIKYREGLLYTTQDDPVHQRSAVVIYQGLQTTTPSVQSSYSIPYPSNALFVKGDGSVVVTAASNATRGLDPTANGSDTLGPWPTAVGWTPLNYTNFLSEAWCWLKADYLDGLETPTLVDHAHNDEIQSWTDLTGKNRNFYRYTDATVKGAPRINLNGMSGRATLRFNGVDQALKSNPNPGTQADGLDLHRTIFPSYKGAVFTAFIVFRPAIKATSMGVVGQACIGFDTSPAIDPHLVVCANRKSGNSGNNAAIQANTELGKISLWNKARKHAISAVVAVAGTGYVIGDILIVTGGTGESAQFRVLTLSGSGVATVELVDGGDYTVSPGNPVATTTTGIGVNCTLTVTYPAAAAPGGTDGHPRDHQLSDGTNRVNFVVATIRHAQETSVWRVNGNPTETTYSSKPLLGTSETFAGIYQSIAGFGAYEGELAEIIVIPRSLSDSDVELFEGYCANYWGGQGRLPTTARGDATTHPYAINPTLGVNPPSKAPLASGQSDVNQLNNRNTILAKFSPGNELKWTLTDYTGLGYDVIGDSAGNLFCLGESTETGGFGVGPTNPTDRGKRGFLRKVIDNGASADANSFVADHWHNRINDGTNPKANAFDDGAYWTLTGVTATPNATTDPIGGNNGYSLADTAAGGAGTFRRAFATAELIDGRDYTLSVFVKQSTAASLRIRLFQTTGFTQVDLTFSTRALAVSTGGTGRRYHWDVQDYGNGWLRLEASLDFQVSDSATMTVEIVPDVAGAQLASFAFGAMLERGTKASAYFNAALQQKIMKIPAIAIARLPRLAIDKFDNVFVPGCWNDTQTGLAGKTMWTARVYDKSLYLVADADIGTAAVHTWKASTAIAANPNPPDYTQLNPGLVRNLFGYTERFSNAYWTKTNVTATADTGISPIGTVTADTLADSSTLQVGEMTRLLALDDGEDYTLSLHIRPLDALTTQLTLDHTGVQGTTITVTWNAAARRIPTYVMTTIGGGVHKVLVTPVENGYFRVSVTATYSAALGQARVRVVPDSQASSQKSILVWGAQLERGQVPTPYQRVDGRWSFAPPPLEGQADPVGITDLVTLVGPALDIEGLTVGNTLHDLKLVEQFANGLPARQTRLVSIVRGGFVVSDRFGEHLRPRGGSGLIDPNARHISACTHLQRVFAVDGKNAAVYEPAVNGRARAMRATKGSFPANVQLACSWRDRLVSARTESDPHAWFMSASGDPFDHDYYTPPITSNKATFSGLSRAGAAPDAINALIPLTSLTIGCDHALWFLDGDPLTGGRWTQLSKVTGVLFGTRTWCEDDKGTVYFFGSRGGFFRMLPGQIPEPMTTERIERRLSDIDLDNFYVECYWNARAEGIEIYVIPFFGSGVIVKHFFWGRRFDEWREDRHTIANTQPTAGCVIDGDRAKDRRLLYANENGHILEWDEKSKNDDGNAIEARERMGPYAPPEKIEVRFSGLEIVLSEDSDSADYKLYANDTPDDPGPELTAGTLDAGRNENILDRVRGANFWLELSNDRVDETFAFEEASVETYAAGRKRRR